MDLTLQILETFFTYFIGLIIGIAVIMGILASILNSIAKESGKMLDNKFVYTFMFAIILLVSLYFSYEKYYNATNIEFVNELPKQYLGTYEDDLMGHQFEINNNVIIFMIEGDSKDTHQYKYFNVIRKKSLSGNTYYVGGDQLDNTVFIFTPEGSNDSQYPDHLTLVEFTGYEFSYNLKIIR